MLDDFGFVPPSAAAKPGERLRWKAEVRQGTGQGLLREECLRQVGHPVQERFLEVQGQKEMQ